MNAKRIANTSIIIVLILMAFFTGFFYARREFVSQNTKSQLSIKTSNSYIKNIFSNIQAKPIYGLFDGNKSINGEILFSVDQEQNKTQVYIRISEIPLKMSGTESTPDIYKLYTASKCCSGLNYELKDTEIQINTENINNKRSSIIASTINSNILDGSQDRLMFMSENKKNPFKIVKDDQKDWPKEIAESNVPFMWVNLQ